MITGKSPRKKVRNTIAHAHFYPFCRPRGSIPVYNFEDLDVLVDQLWQLRLKPGFEIMGNPSNFFSDMENKTQVYLWKDLVRQIAARYVGKCTIKVPRFSLNDTSFENPSPAKVRLNSTYVNSDCLT